jgi:two-component system phosphate regulon response regulator PhoB
MPKVLLAEDDATMVTLLKTLLKLEGYEVLHASTGSDVQAAAEKNHPDVILMDVHLGERTDILTALRRNPAIRDVRVIMSSGMNLDEICRERGADAFLLKPYMPDELIAILKRILKNA